MSGQVKTGDVAKAAMAGFVAGLEKAAADRARGAADEADNDLAALRAAGDRGSAARSLWDFDAARHELSKVPLVTDGARRALNGVGLKLEWLKRFRDTLVEDLNAAPARSLLAEGAQPPLLLTSASATGKALDVAGRTVPWSTVAPTSVLKTAAAFAKLQTTDEARVERQWLLGVYALMSGQTAEAESLLMAASVLRADLRAALPLLLPARRASGGAAASFFEPADWFMSPEFTSLDLGNVGLAGRTDSPPGLGQHTITAAGADIWGTADGCRFLHAPLRGDFEITVRVTRFESTHEWGKAGIMVRESLAPGARNVFFCLSGSKGVTANQRAETGADVNAICESADLQAGCWLRLTRRGEEWTVFNSLDGSAWKWQGKVNLALPAEVFAGLAVSSHDTNYLATATFDFVQAKCIVPVR